MDFIVGGIYTEKYDPIMYIIMEDRESRYHILEVKHAFTSRKDILDFLYTNFDRYHERNDLRFCHVSKNSGYLDEEIDGYLGMIPSDLFDKMEEKLRKESWYGNY